MNTTGIVVSSVILTLCVIGVIWGLVEAKRKATPAEAPATLRSELEGAITDAQRLGLTHEDAAAYNSALATYYADRLTRYRAKLTALENAA